MLIATGRSQRQVVALAERVIEALAEARQRSARRSRACAGDWVLIDAGDVIVHLFRPEIRARIISRRCGARNSTDRNEFMALHLTIIAVGKKGAGPLADLQHLYAERITWPLTIREVEEKRPSPTAAERKSARG